MRTDWAVALFACLCVSVPLPLAAQGVPGAPVVDVGNPAELDLGALRRVIERAERAAVPAPVARQRQLTLEEAVITALQLNLSLEIARHIQ